MLHISTHLHITHTHSTRVGKREYQRIRSVYQRYILVCFFFGSGVHESQISYTVHAFNIFQTLELILKIISIQSDGAICMKYMTKHAYTVQAYKCESKSHKWNNFHTRLILSCIRYFLFFSYCVSSFALSIYRLVQAILIFPLIHLVFIVFKLYSNLHII